MTRRTKIAIALVIAVVVITTAYGAYRVFRSGFWKGPDAMFGDQHLKTAVALIELYRTRHNEYPATLNDLDFVGEWDRIALNAVSYRANAVRTKYCVEVERGWIAKPHLDMPQEFWQGTGYDPGICR